MAHLPSSFHPGHISKNIVYSMAFRLLRICSLEKDFETNLDILKKDFLTPRGYKSNLIDEQFKRIRELPGDTYSIKRKFALEKKKHQKDDSDRVIAPFNFEPLLVNLRNTLKKHHNAMVFRNESLKDIFEKPPMIAYRQPDNLRKLICRAKLYNVGNFKTKRQTRTDAPGWSNCQTNCKICPYTLPKCTVLHGLVSKETQIIKQNVNCNSNNCIYYWRCVKENCKEHPEIEYIGKTKRKFKDRFTEHRDYV